MQAPRHRETLFREANSRLEEGAPWQFAVLPVCHVEHLKHARHTDRMPPDDSVTPCQGLALCIKKAIWSSCRRGCLTAIERHYLRPAMEQEQGPTTNARGLWLGQPQYQLRSNSCID